MRAKLVKENINDLFVPKSKEDIIKEINNLSQEDKDEMLIDVSKYGQLEIVKLLIEAGANVNYKSYYGGNSLILASANGWFEIVKYLLENGADVNAKNKYGSTALVWAGKNNYIIDLLKKYGAKEYES